MPVSMSKNRSNEKGFALILILWIMAALFLMAGEYAFLTRTEVMLARSHQEEQKVYFLALSGLLAALEEISIPSEYQYRAEDGETVFHREAEPGTELEEFAEADTLEGQPAARKNLPLGEGYYFYSIKDMDSRINVNNAKEEQLKKVLTACGMQIGSEMDMVIHSILDWRDRDDEHRLAGVEDDYYTGLPNPYHCKNGQFDTIEELRMVRGVTEEIYSGNPESGAPGLCDLLSVYSNRVNKNTATAEVLEILHGEEGAGSILDRREKNPYKGTEGRSNVYEIIATGKLDRGPATRTIRAIVKKRGPSFQVARWQDMYFEKQTSEYNQENHENL